MPRDTSATPLRGRNSECLPTVACMSHMGSGSSEGSDLLKVTG